jgi:hypothetical protein
MKTKNITSLLATICFYVCLVSCTKDVEDYSITATPPPPPPQVISSDWFPANWEATPGGMGLIFVKGVTNLSVSFLSSGGKVLVFGKGGLQHPDATVLPSPFDGNYIAVGYGSSELRFFLQGDRPTDQSLRFRYILIPPSQMASKGVDYNNYQSVCSYYHISE